MKSWSRKILVLFAVSAALIVVVASDYVIAQDLIAKGDEMWARRDTVDNTRAAILSWENAAKTRPKDEKLLIKIAVAYYWINELSPENDKKTRQDVCERGLASAQKALAANPESIPANYWAMVIQGRLTEAKGILSGFDFSGAIQRSLFISQKDWTFHHAGVYRFWGRVIYYIPPKVGWFFKFKLEDSVVDYKKCVAISPNYLESYYYLAESYLKLGDAQNAKQTLQKMLSISPESLAEYAPENRFYSNKAKALLASLK